MFMNHLCADVGTKMKPKKSIPCRSISTQKQTAALRRVSTRFVATWKFEKVRELDHIFINSSMFQVSHLIFENTEAILRKFRASLFFMFFSSDVIFAL